jgi:TRAP-type mannitol/chloroaromatic compound transport system substrate-binding protein
MFELMINEDVYNQLPPDLKHLIESKAREYNGIITNEFVTLNKQYVAKLKEKNVAFRRFPQSVLNKLKLDTDAVLKDYNGGSTKKIYDSYKTYQQMTPTPNKNDLF